ncbi:MAG: EAL domain-containing protein, partial [Ectothiorhodospiraceae bacterium]|nr:EAL domain-containing protein [Ectothiorhodospiraceae bacterium]
PPPPPPATLEAFPYEPLEGWFDIRAYPLETGLAVFFSDATERHRMIETLRQQEIQLRGSRDQLAAMLAARQTLINSLPAHIALLDAHGRILDVNAYWRRFARENGYPADDHGVGANYLEVCEPRTGSPEEAEQVNAFRAGLRAVLEGRQQSFSQEYPCSSVSEQRWFRVTVNPLDRSNTGPGEPGAVVMHTDITERKLAEQRLNQIAFEDPLTGALTRHGFAHELENRIQRLGWDAGGLVLMLDLISLRNVNDAHGFAAGDQLLCSVTHRLRTRAGETGLVGRAGGDEFMVYLPGTGAGLESVPDQLMAAFDHPFKINGFTIEIELRCGFTRLGHGKRQVEQLLRESELALFQGTTPLEGRRRAGYTAELDARTRERVELTRELRRALERDELALHYQPKVDLRTGAIVGAEALVRWFHPTRGPIPPGRFIPIAEQGQLIVPLGRWVLETACRAVKQWQQAGLSLVPVAVNVSVLEFRLGDYSGMVREALERNGIGPDALTLEITESVFEVEDDRLIEDMRRLKDLGLRLSLDDFGTGYSSLLYLQRYPFDEIKVDREFVNGMLEDRYSREIVRTVIAMSRIINATVIAEGVEVPEEREALLNMGCGIAQGYHFSKPLPESEFRELLTRNVGFPAASSPQNGP